jgi:dipeptidase E
MKLFLTSNLNHYKKINGKKIATAIDNTNGLIGQLLQNLDNNKGIVFIPSDFEDVEKIKLYSTLLFEALRLSGIDFDNYYVVDINNQTELANKLANSSMVYLSGGETYQQNQYFQNINLKELLKNYTGIIMGQSAGSINLADNVYDSPESEEAISKPSHFKGLEKTNINIEPHFVLSTEDFDNDEVFHRNEILKESKLRPLYALCDTSHIFDNGEKQILYGEGYLLSGGVISKLSNHGEIYIINKD